MKICYVIDAHTVLSQRIAEYFANKGHEIQIVCFVSNYQNTHKNIAVKKLGLPKKRLKIPYREHIDNSFTVKSAVQKFDPDIVHGHYISSIASHVLVIPKKYPLVLSAWGSDILKDTGTKHHRILIKKALNRADKITSVAGHISDKIEGMGAPRSKIVTVPFGVDEKLFHPGIERDNLRAELNITTENNVLISTRMFETVYNIETLLKAMKIAVKEIPSTKLILVGSGSLENKLKKLTKKLEIEDSVVFSGFVAHEDLGAYLNLGDVYVSTSLSDGASVSLMEAMACGTFPIVTDIPANHDWIINGKNGFLFESKNEIALAELIEKAFEDKKLQLKAVKQNLGIVKERAEWNQNMAEIGNIYESLVK